MIKLIKMETKRTNIMVYIIVSLIFGITILGFIYFVAYVAQMENEVQFQNYENIFRFTSSISTILFSILSATMYSRLVIGEYISKRLTLLFSYPVSRIKVFIAKIILIVSFMLVSMLLCTAIPIFVFTISESYNPIVSDTITREILIMVFKMAMVSIISVNTIGLLSMAIGFIIKSVPAALVTSFALSGIFGNLVITSAYNTAIQLLISGVSIIIIVGILITFSIKINQMEVC